LGERLDDVKAVRVAGHLLSGTAASWRVISYCTSVDRSFFWANRSRSLVTIGSSRSMPLSWTMNPFTSDAGKSWEK
jgi:hypothetical protein